MSSSQSKGLFQDLIAKVTLQSLAQILSPSGRGGQLFCLPQAQGISWWAWQEPFLPLHNIALIPSGWTAWGFSNHLAPPGPQDLGLGDPQSNIWQKIPDDEIFRLVTPPTLGCHWLRGCEAPPCFLVRASKAAGAGILNPTYSEPHWKRRYPWRGLLPTSAYYPLFLLLACRSGDKVSATAELHVQIIGMSLSLCHITVLLSNQPIECCAFFQAPTM